MKRKLLVLLLASAAALCVAFALPACIGDDGQDGEQNADGHKLTHVEAVEPTCTENGNVEYWICSECDKTFADAQAKEEITNIVIPALGHDFENGVCTQCGMNEPVTEGIVYTLSDDGQSYSVTGYTGTDTEVYIRSVYNGLPVTGIGEEAFSYCSEITSIYIPDSITSIGYGAFGICTSLTNITIPNGVTSIGDYAFASCASLTNITIPNSVISIGDQAFAACASLTNIIIPNSVTSIGDMTFLLCISLTSISISNSVTSIGTELFSMCPELTNISVAEGNAVYHSAGNCIIETASKTLVAGCNGSVIPDDGSVTSIGDWAFAGCISLTSINIPASVKYIGYNAFTICTKLIEVYNLSELEITAGSDDYGGVALYAKDVYTSTSEKSKLDETDDGFITYVNEAIGEYYLIGYTGNETEITLPDDIDGHNYEIHDWAFSLEFKLARVTMPDSVTKIGDYAFYNCSSLKSLTIGNGVTNIGEYAITACDSLKTIYYTGSEAEWNNIDIDRTFNTALDILNAEIVYNYKG